MRVLELYSGIGGMHYALQESTVKGDVIAAVDINTVANDVYRHNFPNVLLMNRNIQSINAAEINNLQIDAILMSPPCQPFTKVGLQRDAEDRRSHSLFHVLTLIPQIKTLKYILIENVKGFENSQTRNSIIECLEHSEFNYKELILSPCQFCIPNTRHRYYLLAKKKGLKFYFNNSILEYNLSQDCLQILPKSKHCLLTEKHGVINKNTNRQCYKLCHIIENCDLTSYLIPQRILQKRAWILDIKTAECNSSCCFTKAYGHYIEGTGSVYCPFTEEVIINAYNQCKTFEKSSKEELAVLNNLKLRYFTPKEISRLMCFPEDFSFPHNITQKQKYRLLGNSINVHVVSRLIYLLFIET